MHPAPSVIIFTTLSGLGFGLLFFLGLGLPPVTGWTAVIFFALGYALAVGGLMASTFHLRHPERALKAFTQWRSSWLSREGVCAVAALLVMALYAALLVFAGVRIAPLGLLGAALSLLTIFTTSMIYAQLRTVPRWHSGLTPPLFLAYALAGGALLSGQVRAAIVLLLFAGILQIAAWLRGNHALARSGTTLASATGLGFMGRPRAFEPPHTGENYLTRELVFVVGRRQAARLRLIAIVLAVLLPIFLLTLPFSHWFALGAVISHLAGVLTARWLFFAQAEHVVGLYYGKR
ncbi:DmsC/YnfH family molybdoenzyme membrane anchor subunit [Sulfitobacter sp. LCG007]